MIDILPKNIFTDFNEQIVGDTSRDAIGMQAIWSHYGRKIFNNKITSITSDIRNYSINLFNHWVIKNLEDVDGTFKDQKDILIRMLENLFVYSILEIEGETLGLQGRLRAERNKEENKSLIVSEELLSSQLRLGVHGRHKTPFTEMDIFNHNLEYNPETWKKIEGIAFSDTQLIQLKNNICDILIKNKDKIDSLIFSDFPNLSNKYEVFKNAQSIPTGLRSNIWLHLMGLTIEEKASTLLVKCINEISQEDFWVGDLVEEALKHQDELNEIEKENLIQISQIEPFLSALVHLFNQLLNNQANSEDVDFDIIQNALEQNQKVANQAFSGAPNDLKKLLKADFSKKAFKETVINYHAEIMQRRGHYPWIVFEGGKVIHKTVIRYNTFNPEPPKWTHGYYINSLIYLIKGMEGNNENI